MTTGWKAAPPDRFSPWRAGRYDSLDRWIRSPAAPVEERIAALEKWVSTRPHRAVLGEARASRMYSPVAGFLRARLVDPAYLSAPESGKVWIVLARSGWLGEWGVEKGLGAFIRSAQVTAEVLSHVAAAATRYVPQARTHLCGILHERAATETDVVVRVALYGVIGQVISSGNRRKRK